MATASPLSNNNRTESNATASAAAAATSLPYADKTPKTLRGLNKPKCIQCGNVARSRCPYQSCKSCCSKAQNPCHIHVLKANATFPDKTPTSNTPLFDQHTTEVSPAATSHRVASLRQLSNNFAQFNNLQVPFRAKKPLTRKEAAAINEWRFSKLKEYKARNVEVENEAFNRYMQNIGLLEEVFSKKSILEASAEDGSISNPNPTSVEDKSGMMITGLKLKLRLNPVRTENFRRRIKHIVDQKLKKLKQCETDDVINYTNNQNELDRRPKKARAERASALSDLVDRLNKARNEDDLKSCFQITSELYDGQMGYCQTEKENELSKEQTKVWSPQKQTDYCLPKLFRTTEIDQESLNSVDVHFTSLEQIEDL
ncbi:hypothetical protein CFOL_v3_28856 [Cephalotus follicularis]|uniref:Uncharacterized protein n=1 Tax=Cephalotus follicularis TaxID=3775 RepID=A0A1Q3CYY0_CEPFO|nr:hypothetical protein CFOL_v3_28856 [Cephalotus follicularis]